MAFYVIYETKTGLAVSFATKITPTLGDGLAVIEYEGDKQPEGVWDPQMRDFVLEVKPPEVSYQALIQRLETAPDQADIGLALAVLIKRLGVT